MQHLASTARLVNLSVDSKWEQLQSAAVLIHDTDLARGLQLLMMNVEGV